MHLTTHIEKKEVKTGSSDTILIL